MGERSIISIAKLGVICWTWLELAYDGLERGFKFFNGLEGAVCAMCTHRKIKENLVTANVSRLK
jgi:hypothetical protein